MDKHMQVVLSFRRPLAFDLLEMALLGALGALAQLTLRLSVEWLVMLALPALLRLAWLRRDAVAICGYRLRVRSGIFGLQTHHLSLHGLRVRLRNRTLVGLVNWSALVLEHADGERFMTPIVCNADLLAWAIDERRHLLDIIRQRSSFYDDSSPAVELLPAPQWRR